MSEIVLLEQDPDDPKEYWTVSMHGRPGVLSEGATIPEALRNMAEAVELFLDAGGLPSNPSLRTSTATSTFVIGEK